MENYKPEKFILKQYAREGDFEVKNTERSREKSIGIFAILFFFFFLFLIMVPIFCPERTLYIKNILLPTSTLLGLIWGRYFL